MSGDIQRAMVTIGTNTNVIVIVSFIATPFDYHILFTIPICVLINKVFQGLRSKIQYPVIPDNFPTIFCLQFGVYATKRSSLQSVYTSVWKDSEQTTTHWCESPCRALRSIWSRLKNTSRLCTNRILANTSLWVKNIPFQFLLPAHPLYVLQQGKVMCLHLSVSHFVQGVLCITLPVMDSSTHPWTAPTPSPPTPGQHPSPTATPPTHTHSTHTAPTPAQQAGGTHPSGILSRSFNVCGKL